MYGQHLHALVSLLARIEAQKMLSPGTYIVGYICYMNLYNCRVLLFTEFAYLYRSIYFII